MEKLCQQYHLLMDEHGIIRVPFLVKGRLVLPPEMSREEIEWAFSQVSQDIHYLRLAHAQLLREPVIDRSTLKYTGEYLYQVLPPVNPIELVESDIDKLVRGPYSLTTQEILQYLQTVSNVLQENWATVERVRQLCQRTTEHPDVYLDAAFAALQFGLDPQAAQCMIDNELSIWQIPGSKFLDGWVEIPSDVLPGLAPLLAQTLLVTLLHRKKHRLASGACPHASCISRRATLLKFQLSLPCGLF